jgi:hypothetical protein
MGLKIPERDHLPPPPGPPMPLITAQKPYVQNKSVHFETKLQVGACDYNNAATDKITLVLVVSDIEGTEQ